MSEVDAKKLGLISSIRTGELTPQDAVKEFEKLTPTQVRTGRIFTPKSREDRMKLYETDRELREKIRAGGIPFICRSFLPDLWIGQGLVIVGAESGRAKSTTAANVVAGFLENSPKTAYVLSNEEAADAVYERIACVVTKTSYLDMFRGKLDAKSRAKVRECLYDYVAPRVEVVIDGSFDMRVIEDVTAVLDTAATEDVGLVALDFFQNVKISRLEPTLEKFQILKKLGDYMAVYGRKQSVPVVVLAQLHETAVSKDMGPRIKNDKEFFEKGFLCIEAIPDFETLTTKFKIHKDRFFGHTGKEIVMDFVGGRYVAQGGESL